MATDGAAPRQGLLVDFGGVLTTDVFTSFQLFCETEGLEPGAVRDRFRGDPTAQKLLFDLEEGKLTEEEFEPLFAELLQVADPANLIDRLFAGMRPDEAMLDAVAGFKRAGVRTGLISNSWGKGRYDRSRFPELFDGTVISGEVGIRKPLPGDLRDGRGGDRLGAGGVRVRRRPAAEPEAGGGAGDGDRASRDGGRDDSAARGAAGRHAPLAMSATPASAAAIPKPCSRRTRSPKTARASNTVTTG